ncbi:MAG: 50S ribosomal protein L28 [Flavobacteriales bacterium]|nr:50S ribosomal protein L28 [Flavobacteriales bacterium]
MSKICELTGKKVISGNNVSHSNRKTRRKFFPNLQTKKFFLEEESKWITLKVSASAIRNIDKLGLAECLKRAKENGFYKG